MRTPRPMLSCPPFVTLSQVLVPFARIGCDAA